MEIGILGLPQSGKSTLFEIMTGVKSREMHGETCVRGLATVPDARFAGSQNGNADFRVYSSGDNLLIRRASVTRH